MTSPDNHGAMTMHQIVAYNFRRARKLRGWTQTQTSDVLAPYLGVTLRQAGVSAIEKTYDSPRRRNIDVGEVVSFAHGFGLPIGWFFFPPNGHGQDTLAHSTNTGDPATVASLLDTIIGTEAGHQALVERIATLARTDDRPIWEALRNVFDEVPDYNTQQRNDLERQVARDALLAQLVGPDSETMTAMARILTQLVALTPTGHL